MIEAVQKKLQAAIEAVLIEVDGDDRTNLIGWLVGFGVAIAARRLGLEPGDAKKITDDTLDAIQFQAELGRRTDALEDMEPAAGRVVADMQPVIDALLAEYPRAEMHAACTFMIGMAIGKLSQSLDLTVEESSAMATELERVMQTYLELGMARQPFYFGAPKARASS